MCGCFLLHLLQHHRFPCIRKQSVFSQAFHPGAVCDVVHIVLPAADEIHVLLQGAGDKLRCVPHGGAQQKVRILQHLLCGRDITDNLADQVFLLNRGREVLPAPLHLLHALAGADIADVVLQLCRRRIPQVAGGQNDFGHGVPLPCIQIRLLFFHRQVSRLWYLYASSNSMAPLMRFTSSTHFAWSFCSASPSTSWV